MTNSNIRQIRDVAFDFGKHLGAGKVDRVHTLMGLVKNDQFVRLRESKEATATKTKIKLKQHLKEC